MEGGEERERVRGVREWDEKREGRGKGWEGERKQWGERMKGRREGGREQRREGRRTRDVKEGDEGKEKVREKERMRGGGTGGIMKRKREKK